MVELPERILSKFVVNDDTGCWEWTASLSDSYGMVRYEGKWARAHIVVRRILIGPIPNGLELDHGCRVKHCVNPDHLEAVTHSQNITRHYTWKSQNSPRTHCQSGHPWIPENIRKSGDCKICKNMKNKEYMARKRSERQ